MRTPYAALTALCLLSPPLAAQTADWGRTTIGISMGLSAGSSLWDVANQPIFSSNLAPGNPPTAYPPDLYHLHRDIRGGFSVSAQGTFYSTEHFGWTVEVTYLGMRFTDGCKVAHDGGDAELATACAFVGSDQKFGQGITPGLGPHDAKGTDHSASATLLEGGVVLRPFRPKALQPLVKLMVGLAQTPKSTVSMESTYGAHADTALALVIYQDETWKAARPEVTAAVGVSSSPNHGLQLHTEARVTFFTQSVVTGPTTAQNLVPPNHFVLKRSLSVLLGLELALRHERGQRY